MIRRLILVAVCLVSLGIFYAAHPGHSRDPVIERRAIHRPDLWRTYQFQEVGKPSAAQYNFSLEILPAKAARPLNVRIAFDVRDPRNYNFAELTEEGIRLGRVESDFEVPFGRSFPVPISRNELIRVLLVRRLPFVTCAVNDALAAVGSDDTFSSGAVFLGATDTAMTFRGVRIQPVSEILFTDDFMKSSGEQGNWQVVSGNWNVKSLDNPSLSANAFTYEGYAAAEPAMSVSGYVFWDSYRFRAAMSSPGGGSMGLVFGYQDPKNYYLMRWAPAGEDRSASSPRQLCRVSDGVLKVLAESPGGYRPGQWYTLEVRLHGSRIQARIDDHPLFDVTEPRMLSGKVGLYTDCRKSSTEECCRFDDVEVRSLHDVLDDFGTCSTIDWNTVGGSWAIRDGTYQVMAPRAARSLLGCADWKNYTVGADLSPSCGQWIGLVAAYLDESSYLLYRVSTQGQGAQELVQVRNGQAEVLERRDARPAEWRTTANHVDLSVNAGVACARVNGTTQLERWLGENPAGKAGLYAEATDFASFDNLEVQFESRPRVLLSVNPVFAHEKSMSNWAAADSDWLSRSTMLDGKVFDVRVHRLQFFGNVEFSLNVVQATSLSQLRMTIGADDEDPREGHHFLIRKASRASASSGADTAPLVAPDSPAASGDAWEAVLLWRDEQLASAVLDEATAPSHVWFRRVGSWLVGYANSRPVIQARTTESGRGRRLSYSHVGGRVRPETAQIFTDHAYSYSFRQASTDWRIGSGTWEVTNRWQCDPRWTFFAGSARRLACLWNKRRFRGDLCVDFAAAIKMDRNRGGRYEYASDINVTVGADGQDLTSGYSFLFGGFDNSRTCIVRKGQIVAQSSQKIPTYTNIHRRWFHVKVVRRGNKLLYWVDDVPLLSYEDPEPLTGDQVAVWTWNNGLMVAQVRISSSDGGEFEAPDRTLPARTACIYDQ